VTNNVTTAVTNDDPLCDGYGTLGTCRVGPCAFFWAVIRRFIRDRSERRDISKGQRAMGHALLFPEAQRGGSRKKSSETKLGFSKVRLSQARTVLAYSLGRHPAEHAEGVRVRRPAIHRHEFHVASPNAKQ
jgi:hypothetical protein